MKNDNIEELFQSLDFDIAEPKAGHEKRFEEKLKKNSGGNNFSHYTFWAPYLAVAASFLFVFLLFYEANGNISTKQDLASISPEMKTTQDFYASAIETELYRLKENRTPETTAVINDALRQLQILETDYEKLKTDLVKSGQDQRVIYAMITNFQKRIDLLNSVLEKVKTINKKNQANYENELL